MAGARHKQKGNRVERKIVDWFRELGLKAKRVPLSGSADGFEGDIRLELPRQKDEILVEVKARKSPPPWLTIKKWLGENQMLVLAEDFKEPLFVLPESTLEAILLLVPLDRLEENGETH